MFENEKYITTCVCVEVQIFWQINYFKTVCCSMGLHRLLDAAQKQNDHPKKEK